MTFPVVGARRACDNDWWDSIESRRGSAAVYLTGYRYMKVCSNNTSMTCTWRLIAAAAPSRAMPEGPAVFRSDNGGTTYTPMAQTGLTCSNQLGDRHRRHRPTTPTTVYVHVKLDDNSTTGDSIYMSIERRRDVDEDPDHEPIRSACVFLARSNGDLIAVDADHRRAEVSHDDGTTGRRSPNAPHINCLVENAAGERVGVHAELRLARHPRRRLGIMKTTDLATWTGVLRYQDITGVVSCGAGTVQTSSASTRTWASRRCGAACATSSGSPIRRVDCTGSTAARSPAIGGDDAGNTMVTPPKKGCCDAGGSAAGRAALGWRSWLRYSGDEGDVEPHAVAPRSPRVPLAASVVPDQRDGDAGGSADRDAHAARRGSRHGDPARLLRRRHELHRARSRERRGRALPARAAVRHPDRGATCARCRGCCRRAARGAPQARQQLQGHPRRRQGPLPAYYRRTFHWQTDGYFSDHSAEVYELGVELLFRGTADVMRRQIIPPITRWLARHRRRRRAAARRRLRHRPHAAPARVARIRDLRLHGVDLSPAYIKLARKRLLDVDEVTLAAENAEALPLADGDVRRRRRASTCSTSCRATRAATSCARCSASSAPAAWS